MAVLFKSYSKKSDFSDNRANKVTILSGASGGTIVKSLEIVGSPTASCKVNVYRTKIDDSSELSKIPVDLKAKDYLVLWEGFFVIESGVRLEFDADAADVCVIANVVEMTNG